MPGKIKILVVDDDASLCVLNKTKLELKGHTVETSSDGSEALCQMYRFNPDVVLLDITMPGLGGDELVSTIKAFRPAISVIMITASKDPEVKQECLRRGAVAYFEKPVDFNELDSKLKEVFQSKQNAPLTSKPLGESEAREVELVLKLLEKRELMTRQEVLEEIKRMKR